MDKSKVKRTNLVPQKKNANSTASKSRKQPIPLPTPRKEKTAVDRVAQQNHVPKSYARKALKERSAPRPEELRLAPQVINPQTNTAASSAFRAVLEASVSDCLANTTPCSYPIQTLLRYLEWACVAALGPNGRSKINYVTNLSTTGVQPSSFPPFPEDLFVPRSVLYYLLHCCGKKTKWGVEFAPRLVVGIPEASSDVGPGYLVPRTVSATAAYADFYGSNANDDDYSVMGNNFSTANTSILNPEYRFSPSATNAMSFDDLWAQTQSAKDHLQTISQWFATTKMAEPMRNFWKFAVFKRGLPVAPDYSANAFPVPTNQPGSSVVNTNQRYASIVPDKWDPDIALFLQGTLVADATSADLGFRDFVSLKLYYASANDSTPFAYKVPVPSVYGQQPISHRHTTFFVHLLNRSPFHPHGIKRAIMTNKELPGITKMHPKYALLSCSQWNQRLIETVCGTYQQGAMGLDGSQFSTNGSLGAFLVLTNSVLTAHVIRHCGGWAEQLILNNDDVTSNNAVHDGYKSSRVAVLQKAMIDTLGPVVDESGQLTLFILDSRPPVTTSDAPAWDGTTQVFTGTSATGANATIWGSITPALVPGGRIPVTPNWWLFLMYPNLWQVSTTIGRAWMPYQFVTNWNNGSSYVSGFATDVNLNLVPITGNQAGTYDVSTMGYVYSSASAYPLSSATANVLPPRIPITQWSKFEDAVSMFPQQRMSLSIYPRKFGHISLLSVSGVCTSMNFVGSAQLPFSVSGGVQFMYSSVVLYCAAMHSLTPATSGIGAVTLWNEFNGSLRNGTSNSINFATNNLTGYAPYRYTVQSSVTHGFTDQTITSALDSTYVEDYIKRASGQSGLMPGAAVSHAVESQLAAAVYSAVQSNMTNRSSHVYENKVLLTLGASPYYPENVTIGRKVDFHSSPTVADDVQKGFDWTSVINTGGSILQTVLQLLPLFLKSKTPTIEGVLFSRGILFGRIGDDYVVINRERVPQVFTSDQVLEQLGISSDFAKLKMV